MSGRRGVGALWIVQDGVLAGPGAAQTLPYLRGLSAEGFRMELLSFEKPGHLGDADRIRATGDALRRDGIRWTRLPFGRGGPGLRTLVQVMRGAATGRGRVRSGDLRIVHARSYLPALMGLAAGRPLLFDMRGLWPRERVDGGLWPEGSARHRAGERLERLLLRKSGGVVVLATGALEHLPPIEKPLRVIPTAVDLARFRPGLPPPEGAEALRGGEVFVIAGALGTWYLLREMLDLVAEAVRRRESARVLLLTEEEARPALEGLRARGVPADRVVARGVPHAEVPNWFSLAAAGILLIRSAPSKRASAPTKLGEFLACGVPVMITPGIGDTEALVTETRTGVVVRNLSREGYARALDSLEALRKGPRLAERCRRTALERLSLPAAVREYAELYRELAGGRPCD